MKRNEGKTKIGDGRVAKKRGRKSEDGKEQELKDRKEQVKERKM